MGTKRPWMTLERFMGWVRAVRGNGTMAVGSAHTSMQWEHPTGTFGASKILDPLQDPSFGMEDLLRHPKRTRIFSELPAVRIATELLERNAKQHRFMDATVGIVDHDFGPYLRLVWHDETYLRRSVLMTSWPSSPGLKMEGRWGGNIEVNAWRVLPKVYYTNSYYEAPYPMPYHIMLYRGEILSGPWMDEAQETLKELVDRAIATVSTFDERRLIDRHKLLIPRKLLPYEGDPADVHVDGGDPGPIRTEGVGGW